MMNPYYLKKFTNENIKKFIRESLHCDGINFESYHFSKEQYELALKNHKRFDFSGQNGWEGHKNNFEILQTFGYLGIFDYTTYLFLSFYKGTCTLHFQYASIHDDSHQEINLTGEGTVDIIYKIFELTIFTNKYCR